jgi:ATP-dependent RNA helicase SUPV3L1/SUV3
MIEVWRPHRHQHQGRRPDRNKDRRPQRTPQPSEGQAAPAEGGAPPKQEERRKGNFQKFRREGEGGRPSGRPDRGPRPQGQGGKGGRPDRDQRRGDRPFASSEKPAPRERQPDPNSPFAKLLALKSELEGKNKKD